MGGIYNDLLKDMDIEEKDYRSPQMDIPIKVKENKLYSSNAYS
jgi:hypothetical protein